MKPRVTIVDYGVGNLFSVRRAFEVCGADVVFASTPEDVEASSTLVLPGVGAFDRGMGGLYERRLADPIKAHAKGGKPLLGICLGMQMLASVSEEFGEHEGLGLIPGRVTKLPAKSVDGQPTKIPNIGWAKLQEVSTGDWYNTPLSTVRQNDYVYMVHSYYMKPDDPTHQFAVGHFGGHAICVAVGFGKIMGFQFHPEKSGITGLKILSRYLTIQSQ